MREAIGNIWQLAKGHIVVITTNGFVKKNGECVMGRGIALQAKKLFPNIPTKLGSLIKSSGNQVYQLGAYGPYKDIWTFPVKRAWDQSYTTNVVEHMQHMFRQGERVPGWALVADPLLINLSAEMVSNLVKFLPDNINIYMPRPGCGAGELLWENVKPWLENLLCDRFICCDYSPRSVVGTELVHNKLFPPVVAHYNDDATDDDPDPYTYEGIPNSE